MPQSTSQFPVIIMVTMEIAIVTVVISKFRRECENARIGMTNAHVPP